MNFTTLFLGLVLVCRSTALRYVMYVDEWHKSLLPSQPTDITANITHAIMAFGNSTNFTTGDVFMPWENVSTFRARFPEYTKFMVSIGGWGNNEGFSTAVKTNKTLDFAQNVASMLTNIGADGVDIDWEYPGGNGADYKKIPNQNKTFEIGAFPTFLQQIKDAIGINKTLSIATPGLQRDMLAYTADTANKTFAAVDMVNIMSYDLMNRRDNLTKHHASVAGCSQAVQSYLDLGLDPKKINLGFAFYAKYFSAAIDTNCTAMNALGCTIAPAEADDGEDNHKSGTLTFEKINMAPPPANLQNSANGTCGPDSGKCPNGLCCSPDGWCGNTTTHCDLGCLSDYGTCNNVSVIDSWKAAQQNGMADAVQGGQYFYDTSAKLFWTWDTQLLMERKFTDIVDEKNLGGVMAWSLGEDNFDWSHVKTLRDEVVKRP